MEGNKEKSVTAVQLGSVFISGGEGLGGNYRHSSESSTTPCFWLPRYPPTPHPPLPLCFATVEEKCSAQCQVAVRLLSFNSALRCVNIVQEDFQELGKNMDFLSCLANPSRVTGEGDLFCGGSVRLNLFMHKPSAKHNVLENCCQLCLWISSTCKPDGNTHSFLLGAGKSCRGTGRCFI